MSRRHFKTIATVELGHTFYANERCRDISLQPTHETAALLRNLRLHWGSPEKNAPSKFHLLQEFLDGNVPLIPLPSEFRLRFVMQLHQPSFLNFTDFGLQGLKAADEVYLFENQATGQDLIGSGYVSAKLVGDYLDLSGLDPNSTVSIATPSGSPLLSITALSSGEARIDLAKLPTGEPIQNGQYVVTYTSDTNVVKELNIYKDPSLQGTDIFGILHLDHGNGKSISDDFSHEFLAKSTQWRYWVLLPSTIPSDIEYSISHPTLSFDQNIVPAISNSADPVQIAMRIGNSPVAVEFVSSVLAPIRYSETARSGLSLVRTNTTTQSSITLLTHLPNPAAGDPMATVIVKVNS